MRALFIALWLITAGGLFMRLDASEAAARTAVAVVVYAITYALAALARSAIRHIGRRN